MEACTRCDRASKSADCLNGGRLSFRPITMRQRTAREVETANEVAARGSSDKPSLSTTCHERDTAQGVRSPVMCSDQRLAHPDQPVAKSITTYALRGHARALKQQEQFVRQHFGLRQFGSGA